MERKRMTLPGLIPGLLQECSPGIYKGNPVKVLAIRGDNVALAGASWNERTASFRGAIEEGFSIKPITSRKLIDVDLDLEDPTGMRHAIWWLAKQFGMAWQCCTFNRENIDLYEWELHSRYGDVSSIEFFPELPEGHEKDLYIFNIHQYKIVESINERELAPFESYPLGNEFGFRFADIEALRRICRHVAGLGV